jgi:acetyl esterase/lipase
MRLLDTPKAYETRTSWTVDSRWKFREIQREMCGK